MDEFQERYLKHQEIKLNEYDDSNNYTNNKEHLIHLKQLMYQRRSQRFFNDEKLNLNELCEILDAIALTPSSCNRQAVYVKQCDPEYAKSMLVGAKKWGAGVSKVLFVFASKEAYKSPNEKAFMPYLDMGACIQSVYLMCEGLGVGCCFVNPNIHEENKRLFIDKYGDDYFGGAFILGHYDNKAPFRKKREWMEVLK